MADKPALFSSPMVRALLREIAEPGTGKTQTRRVIEPHKAAPFPGSSPSTPVGKIIVIKSPARLGGWVEGPTFLPKYAVGDRIWVREAWRAYHRYDAKPPRELMPSTTIYYEAGEIGEDEISVMRGKLRPSMFMPKWASRITLEVTGVKVERLQDCSEADAIAEGIERASWRSDKWLNYLHPAGAFVEPIQSYRSLWDSINGTGAWDKNPWVAAYTFRPILGNLDQIARAA